MHYLFGWEIASLVILFSKHKSWCGFPDKKPREAAPVLVFLKFPNTERYLEKQQEPTYIGRDIFSVLRIMFNERDRQLIIDGQKVVSISLAGESLSLRANFDGK